MLEHPARSKFARSTGPRKADGLCGEGEKQRNEPHGDLKNRRGQYVACSDDGEHLVTNLMDMITINKQKMSVWVQNLWYDRYGRGASPRGALFYFTAERMKEMPENERTSETFDRAMAEAREMMEQQAAEGEGDLGLPFQWT